MASCRTSELNTTIQVAVYWPGEGYGGADSVPTMAAARLKADELRRLGYGVPGKNPIHIIETTRKVSVYG